MFSAVYKSGAFVVNYNSDSLGATEDGFRLGYTPVFDMIAPDALGGSEVDGVFRGIRCSLAFTLIGFNTNLATVLANFMPSSTGFDFGLFGKVGATVSPNDAVSSLVITNAANAANPNPQSGSIETWTFSRLRMPPNFNWDLLLNHRLRRLPLRFLCVPDPTTADALLAATPAPLNFAVTTS